ncbi:MAG: hypothetical protein JOZ47_14380 [Kutzneria sp.]|nr:hypothetical protein [Kutzneria sp.]MBV9846237.1 hypothetical protein [Kutzneria sp.]
MDPRDRADATLARASARSRWVVTPDNATSPMDAKTTARIPRAVVSAADPEITVVIPAEVASGGVPVPQQQSPEPEPATKQLPGLIPTTQQISGRRLSLSERLSGALDPEQT